MFITRSFNVFFPAICSSNKVIDVPFFYSKQLPESIHHLLFMLHKGVGITVEGNGRILVAEDLGKRFYVHTAFNGAGGKSMPQGMKSFVRYFQFFEE